MSSMSTSTDPPRLRQKTGGMGTGTGTIHPSPTESPATRSSTSTTSRIRTWTRNNSGDGNSNDGNNFLISTDPSLIPIPTLNEAFESEEMYWAKPLPEDVVREMLDRSVCFGLYLRQSLPNGGTVGKSRDDDDESLDRGGDRSVQSTTVPIPTSSSSSSGDQPTPTKALTGDQQSKVSTDVSSLIGFARAISDHVTFFYLTDVYIHPKYQKRGLGKWLISCVQELVEQDMPFLRRTMCIVGAGHDETIEFYRRLMKMEVLGGGCS
ncbi:hypothetical protein HRR91_000149 [Exophiala dermatitidis]|nr:hypothetical protein HRR91_000149 [Exophiala dermatitidis]